MKALKVRNEALNSLIFDSLQELREFVQRIELRGGEKKVCVIVFSNFFALQEWKAKEASILGRMRELYKQRGLKDIVTFNKVVAEAKGQNLFYKECSKGKFEILSSSPEIRAIFEKIKNAIKENLERERRQNDSKRFNHKGK